MGTLVHALSNCARTQNFGRAHLMITAVTAVVIRCRRAGVVALALGLLGCAAPTLEHKLLDEAAVLNAATCRYRPEPDAVTTRATRPYAWKLVP